MPAASIRMRAALSCYLLIGVIQYGTVCAIDPGYIEAVEADVAEFASNEFHPPANSSWMGNADSGSVQLMDLNGFSAYLQEKSPGSYIFYKNLPGKFKGRLHRDYLTTGDIDRIKKDIFKYTRELKD
ncbi:hypothetical protein [Candidatus Thiodiazotropha sp. LNASS1]|uniref:hypothetical protein n=1 Tax=Candidatus Thiodiazotropha sp. LNASS1 TaxID=3096260 RepID=UPI0034DED9D9